MFKKILFLLLSFFFLITLVFITLANIGLNSNQRIKIGSNYERFVLQGVKIIELDHHTKQSALSDIYIDNGRIVEILPHQSSTKPKNHDEYFQITMLGKFVMPGLIDSHVHIEDSAYLASTLAHGVTTVRGMRGNIKQLKWKNELKQQLWTGSDFYVASPIIGSDRSDPFQFFIEDPASVNPIVSSMAEAGYDYIKYYGNSNSDIFYSLIQETEKHEIPLSQHGFYLPEDTPMSELKHLVSLEHIENIFSDLLSYKFDINELKKITTELNNINVPIVTTLSVFEELTLLSSEKQGYLSTVKLELMNPAHYWLIKHLAVDRWLQSDLNQAEYNHKMLNFLKEIVFLLNERGIKLALGSDSGALIGQAGVATINELKLLKSSGLSNISILRIATKNSAEAIGLESIVGVIQKGYEADMLILDSDPLVNLSTIEKPHAILSNGIVIDSDEIIKLKNNGAKVSGFLPSLAFQIKYVFSLAIHSV